MPLTLTLHRDFNHNELLMQLVTDREAVTLGSLETEVNYGYKQLTFSVRLPSAGKDFWLDRYGPFWMCDVRLTDGNTTIFEGQLAEITETSEGVDCAAAGYWNALYDDWISVDRNIDAWAASGYGQTVQGIILYLIHGPVWRLNEGSVPGPSSPFSTGAMTEPAKFGDYIKEALDLSVENKSIIYHWYFYVWENRKVYTAEFNPTTPKWRVRRKPGTNVERRLTLDGYATTSYVDYNTGGPRALTDEYTDLVEVRRLGYRRVNYRRESALTDNNVAEVLAKKELQTRNSPVRLGNVTVKEDMEDIAGLSWPGYMVRAGETVRVLDWVAPGGQRDFCAFHTAYSFRDKQLTLDLNDAPPRLALSKGGVVYST